MSSSPERELGALGRLSFGYMVARAPRVQESARILGFIKIKIPYGTKVLALAKLNV